MSADSGFSLVLHGDPRLLDMVDDEWASETLCDDDILVPAALVPPPSHMDLNDNDTYVKTDQDKWADTDGYFLKDSADANAAGASAGA
ncbi:hypothetical protein BC831DRAFT_508543 [Entophlyctis helioformis]|nr:hypothetical protein BC831DRAFT_508543 [Entophlyctis helioformis]